MNGKLVILQVVSRIIIIPMNMVAMFRWNSQLC